ncbi:hypothetical protein ACKWTF_006245 [Chironomus riparius]
MGSNKKHKKHKSERKSKYDERPPSLKLILKVSGTPEYGSSNSPYQINMPDKSYEHSQDHSEKHKKSKKKKKKKDREKRHKHHKKERHNRRSSVEESTIMDDEENAQSVSENMNLYYASMFPSSAISASPATKPMIPMVQEEKSSFHTLQNVPLPEIKPETPSQQLSPMTPQSVDSATREPRTCVLKLKQQRNPLAKLLDHLLKALEKRDPHQFFAWPVTDDIAPGYSSIISNPMDFSSIRQKNEESKYQFLQEFSDDFQLMCENAIKYNHHETVYNKAARRLLQAGMRLLQPENLVRGPYTQFIKDLTVKELGFDPTLKMEHHDEAYSIDSVECDDTGLMSEQPDPLQEEREKRERIKAEMDPKTQFEPFVDPMTADEILEQVQKAARDARTKLNKRKAHSMGFLRANSDGTSSMKIIIPSENGIPEKTRKLGELTGKLEKGTGLLQSFREDRRNAVKMPKPLNYGSFSSFAPTFDTRFSNLTVDETELILNTYGNDDSASYATSISKFTQDSVYGSTLANKLLDLLTNGDHSKTMEVLMEAEHVKQTQKEVDKMLPDYQKEAKQLENVAVNFDELRTLKDIGVDISFLKTFEKAINGNEQTENNLQTKLDTTSTLIEQLHQVQSDRLSAPLPQHLSLVAHPNKQEMELADQITSNITTMAKKLPPFAISSVGGVRKAMGMSNIPLENELKRMTKFNKPIDVNAGETDMEIEPVASGTAEFDNEIRQLLGTD